MFREIATQFFPSNQFTPYSTVRFFGKTLIQRKSYEKTVAVKFREFNSDVEIMEICCNDFVAKISSNHSFTK